MLQISNAIGFIWANKLSLPTNSVVSIFYNAELCSAYPSHSLLCFICDGMLVWKGGRIKEWQCEGVSSLSPEEDSKSFKGPNCTLGVLDEADPSLPLASLTYSVSCLYKIEDISSSHSPVLE